MKKSYTWVKLPPTEEEISRNADGSEFIPIGIVERLLERLDPYWGTERFEFKLLVLNGHPLVNASLELTVSYAGRTRRLIGAITAPVSPELDPNDPYVNSNLAATAKSECIKNAVKAIGLAFGQGLNDRLAIVTPEQKATTRAKYKPAAVDMTPDHGIQQTYNHAVETVNQELMERVRSVYPAIEYTGTKTIANAES